MSAIILKGFDALEAPRIPIESITHRNSLIAKIDCFEVIETQYQYDAALTAEKSVEADCRAIEAARVTVTAPFLKSQRLAMALKNEYCTPSEAAVARSKALRLSFARKRDEEAAEAQLKADAEAVRRAREAFEKQRIEDNRIAAAKAAAQKLIDDAAEARRVKFEAELRVLNEQKATADQIKSIEAQHIKAQFAAMAASARLEVEAEAAVQHGEARAEAARLAAMSEVMVAAQAPTTKTVWKWEVVDALKLATAHPNLVTITPKAREIDAQIKAGVRDIPGLRMSTERKLSD